MDVIASGVANLLSLTCSGDFSSDSVLYLVTHGMLKQLLSCHDIRTS